MIDFTKAEIGLEVWHPEYGNGVIVVNYPASPSKHPIIVKFEDLLENFTKEGKVYSSNRYPTLCIGHREPLDQGIIPEDLPKPLKFDGNPVWAYVGEYKEDYKLKLARQVIATNNERIIAINNGYDNMESIKVSNWKYAWEIPEEEKIK